MAEVTIQGGGELDGAILKGAATEATLQQLVKALGGAGSSTGAKVANAAAQNPNKKNVNDLAKESKGLVDEFKHLKAEHETLTGATKLFGAQLLVGSDKFANYTAAFTGYMQQFGVGFELLAKGIQLLVNSIDNQIEEFRKLSMVGADFGNSLFDSRYAAIDAGLSLKEFSGQVQSNARMLALLGGSTIAGTRRFQAISREIQFNSQPIFSRLGLTMAETTDLMTDYLDIQTTLGRGQKMSNAQLVSGTKNYIMELDLLSRITGISRKQLAEEQKKLSVDPSFQLLLSSMPAGAGKNVLDFVTAFTDSPELQRGIKDIFTFDGAAITDEGQRLQQLLGAPFIDVVRQLKNEEITREEALKQFGEMAKSASAVSDADKKLVSQLIAGGQTRFIIDAQLQKQVGLGKQVSEAISEQAAATQNAQKSITDFSSAITKFTNSLITLFKPFIESATNFLSGAAKYLDGITKMISGLGDLEKKFVLFGGAIVAVTGSILAYKAGKSVIGTVVGGAKSLVGGGGSNAASEVLGGISKQSGLKTALVGLAEGLKAFGMGSVKILIGAGVLAMVIGILGAGVGAAFYAVGFGLEKFGAGLASVTAVDGDKLKSVASGAKDLAIAMAELAGGGLKQGFTSIFTMGKGGPKEFAKNINSALDSLDKNKIESYTVALNNLSTSFSGLNTSMSKSMTAANKSSTDKLDELNMTMKMVLTVLEQGTRYSKETATNTADS